MPAFGREPNVWATHRSVGLMLYDGMISKKLKTKLKVSEIYKTEDQIKGIRNL